MKPGNSTACAAHHRIASPLVTVICGVSASAADRILDLVMAITDRLPSCGVDRLSGSAAESGRQDNYESASDSSYWAVLFSWDS